MACAHVDPRIHFALVCGAKGCPPIKVYSAANLQNELTFAARSFLESGFHIKYNNNNQHHHNNNDNDNGHRHGENEVGDGDHHDGNYEEGGVPEVEISLNMILKWFKYDFISDFDEKEKAKEEKKGVFGNNVKLLLWVREYLSPQKSEELTRILKRGNFKITHMPYDWSLNA